MLPFAIPDWLPWWVPLVLLIPTLLWTLAFLLLPFSVIGLKSRLDGLEARLDELHAEIRTLSLRLPETARAVDFDEVYASPPSAGARRPEQVMRRPPIPPAIHEVEESVAAQTASGLRSGKREAVRRDRMEPRLDWPR